MRQTVRRAPKVTASPLHLVPATQPEAEQGRQPDLSRRGFAVAIMAALVFGVMVRALWVSASDFPLNDGGMFLEMTSDLQRAGYVLPYETTYNDAEIPFAYPPLGFYAAAALDDLTPLSLYDVFRVLPLAISVLTILAFFLFARGFTRSRTELAAAVFAFALIPRSFLWLIMGGGLTRGLGFLFAILALQQLDSHFRSPRWRSACLAGVCGGLAALSHLEMAWFLAFSAVLLLLARGRTRSGVQGAAVAAACAVAVAAPWLIAVVAQHGVAPFRAAIFTSSPSEANPVLSLLAFDPTNELMFALIAATALLGVVVCLGRREYFLPLWVLAAGLLDPRAFGTVASVPLALLAAIAVVDVLLPLLSRKSLGPSQSNSNGHVAPSHPVLPVVVVSVMIGYALISALAAGPRLLVGLNPDDRAAMAWVAENTPREAGVLVVSGDRWAVDRTSEWFPVQADRRSVATVQGSEWLPDDAFARQLDAYNAAQRCADADAACLDAWRGEFGIDYGYVYIPKLAPLSDENAGPDELCCAALLGSLSRDTRYEMMYDGPRATIFALR